MPDKNDFKDTMAVMDIVDAARHEDALIEKELSAEDRRKAFVEKIRDIYRKQGIEVSDEVLKEAVETFEGRRFRHQPLASGTSRTFWLSYVRRWRIAAFASIPIVLAGAGWGAHYSLVTLPAERAVLAEQVAIDESLPRELQALLAGASERIKEDSAFFKGDDLAVRTALSQRDGTAARAGLSRMRSVVAAADQRDRARQQEIADRARIAAQAEADRVRVVEEKREAGQLRAAISQRLDAASTISHSAEASAAVRGARSDLSRAEGNLRSLQSLRPQVDALFDQIALPLIVRIVDRAGTLSGFYRDEDGGPRVWYVVVEAVRPDGVAVALPVVSAENDGVSVVKTWAVQVPERVYAAVGRDKTSDGTIDDRVVGEKSTGEMKVRWSIQTNGKTISDW
jgi:hypothetical protein